MTVFERHRENPIIQPRSDVQWESSAAFNPCIVKDQENKFHLLYRAQSSPTQHEKAHFSISSIGYTQSTDGLHFNHRRQLIEPELEWERYGCEDPRITHLNDRYYIFYTALSTYPFEGSGIKIGLAITNDFQHIEKHPVTPFNSKAMALFSEKINGKFAAVLTVNTDNPPAKIALALFDREEQMWSEAYWNDWYANLDSHVIPLLRSRHDHLEVGAPPVKTEQGWLLIYCYIHNYFSPMRSFNIEAVLLDLDNPQKVIGKLSEPLIIPEKEYELLGDVPNVIFPSGALVEDGKLSIYYGATDTTSCVAEGDVKTLLREMHPKEQESLFLKQKSGPGFKKYTGNPIIMPRPEFAWEAKATFNPTAIYEAGKVHIIYRAMSDDNVSVFGYASSKDGLHIDERLPLPIYVPRAAFEKSEEDRWSGCEDPRITKMNDRYYLFYTAYNGENPRIAFASITVEDFLRKQWDWAMPMVITPPGIDKKNACLLPKKIKGKYVIFTRNEECLCINFLDNLTFGDNQWLGDQCYLIKPYCDGRGTVRVGIAATPIETEAGWLLFYHWLSSMDATYRIGAILFSLDEITDVVAQTSACLLEPEMDYEKVGQINNVVFPCGAVLKDEEIFLYYGGGDEVVGVAKIAYSEVLRILGVASK